MNTLSEVCLAELEEQKLDCIEQDSQQNGLLKKMNTQEKSSQKDSQISESIKTSQKSISQNLNKWMLLQEDFPVKTSVSQIRKEKESKEREADCGIISIKQLGFYDQKSHSLKTAQTSLTKGCHKSLQTLPRSGMMLNGKLFELQMSEQDISDRECLLWRTPTATDGNRGVGLTVKSMLKGNIIRKSGHPMQICLHAQTLYRKYVELGYSKDNLPTVVRGQLNPNWIEWLMGFPIGWTDLDVSEMQLSHKLQNTLEED